VKPTLPKEPVTIVASSVFYESEAKALLFRGSEAQVQFNGPVWYDPSAVFSGDEARWIFLGVALLALLALRYVARPRIRSRRFYPKPRFGQARASRQAAQPDALPPARPAPAFDSAAQMHAIAPFEFETQPLLNKSETPLLYLLERVASEVGGGFRVMAQTSLGEIIRPRPAGGAKGDLAEAYRAVNSKRLDFTIFNKVGKLVLGVEYQGQGHYGQNAFMRDAIKREVLRRAGVPMLEVPAKYDPAKIAAEVKEILDANRALLRPTGYGTSRRVAAGTQPAAG
jgi:hypothetical protein